MYIYIAGKSHHLTATDAIGKGGEADVFKIAGGRVVKIYKQPDHPDLVGLDHEQQAAKNRLIEQQQKLPAFPKNLPTNRVVVPMELATDKSGQIIGFTMPFLKGTEVLFKYAERNFRQKGIDSTLVTKIFQDLHTTLGAVHKAGVVIGDFNDLNILVEDTKAYIIDADSFQFGKYHCKVFTARFVDPLLCDPGLGSLMLMKPHNSLSDWYAYNIMLMQCLLFVGPYGGVYKPANPKKRMTHDARPLHRVTVFDPEVKYPKPAIKYDVLPDELLEHFHQVFLKDKRIPFPAKLLEMHWTQCSCGMEYARSSCPVCSTPAPGEVKETIVVRGRVTCTRIFKLPKTARILYATMQNGSLKWLYHENGTFKRENGATVTKGDVDPHMRFRIHDDATLIAKDGQVLTFKGNQPVSKLMVDSYRQIPIFDANAKYRYWIDGGKLQRDDPLGIEQIGDVLPGQTLMWVGTDFGFGFYRAGNLCQIFTFPANHKGINDSIKTPVIRGQLFDSTCLFGKDLAWFFISTQDAGLTKNQCHVIRSNGKVEASAEAIQGDGSWLGNLRGKTAAGNYLFSATDDGIVRLEIDKGQIAVTKEFPDTEPFVDTHSRLYSAREGLYVVDRDEIKLIKIS